MYLSVKSPQISGCSKWKFKSKLKTHFLIIAPPRTQAVCLPIYPSEWRQWPAQALSEWSNYGLSQGWDWPEPAPRAQVTTSPGTAENHFKSVFLFSYTSGFSWFSSKLWKAFRGYETVFINCPSPRGLKINYRSLQSRTQMTKEHTCWSRIFRPYYILK